MGGVFLVFLLFVIPHIVYYQRDAQANLHRPKRMEFSQYHPLIQEALETHVKKCSPAIYAYLVGNGVPITFANLPAERNSQRLVDMCASHIELSREYDTDTKMLPAGGSRQMSDVAKIAKCLIHEGTHCQRLDASNLVTMIGQEHRYAFGMWREEVAAYEAEGALGFGIVRVRSTDIADERRELLLGLLCRDASGILLIALVVALARERAEIISPLSASEPDWPVVHVIRRRLGLSRQKQTHPSIR